MCNIEEVGNGATDGDDQTYAVVDPDAGGAGDIHEVEVKGVDEESGHAVEEEDTVPEEDGGAAGVEDEARDVPGKGGGGAPVEEWLRDGEGEGERERGPMEGEEREGVHGGGHGVVVLVPMSLSGGKCQMGSSETECGWAVGVVPRDSRDSFRARDGG